VNHSQVPTFLRPVEEDSDSKIDSKHSDSKTECGAPYDEHSAAPEDEQEGDVKLEDVLTIKQFQIDSDELLSKFREKFDENEPDKEMVNSLRADYLDLVAADWVQINEKRVLYADRRTRHTNLPRRGDMTAEECNLVHTEWVTRDKNNFVQAMSAYQVLVPRLKGKKKEVIWETKDVVDLLLKWGRRQIFDRVVFEPDQSKVGPREFNLWSNFAIDEAAAKAFVRRRGWSDKRVLKELKPWLNHMFHIIADGYRSHFDYLMNWFTWIMRHKSKVGTALLVMSDHGAGKSVVLEMYAEILGFLHACTLTKSDELTGTFNAHLGFKILVISEEATYGGTKKDQGHLKSLVTAKSINIRPLYHPMLTMVSRHNLVVISNLGRHVLPIDATERRYACFYPSSKYAGIQTAAAKKHFDALLDIPPQLIAYFHYFIWNSGQFAQFNPRMDIPVTACTADQKIKSIDNSARFILTKLQTTSRDEWSVETEFMTIPQLFAEFSEWCDKNRVGTWQRASIQSFVKSVKRHLLITRRDFGDSSGMTACLVRNLPRQRLAWAVSMGLPRFPSLVPLEEDGDTHSDEESDEEAPNLTTYMDVCLDDGLSDDEKEKKIERLSKRRRITRDPGCPVGCNKKHPKYVKMSRGGEYEVCDETDEGATRWHDVPSGPGSVAGDLAPVFLTADAVTS